MNFKKLTLILFTVLFSFQVKAAICTSTTSGTWGSSSTWNCGGVPQCGDTIVIAAGTTVTVANTEDYDTPSCTTPMLIVINGTLQFQTGKRIDLPCGSGVYVNAGGSIQPGTGGGSSDWIKICNTAVWKASDGTATGPTCFPPGCSSLPIELVAFTGFLESKAVFLQWKTVTETNNSHFEVEKSSDGYNFYKLSAVPSKGLNGNSTSLLVYNEIDSDIKHPLYYYRLKQVDFDGTFKYSNKIFVRVYPTEFKIYPNPNVGTFKIDIPTKEPNQSVDLKIYDQYSQLISDNRYSVINDKITGSVIEVIPQNPLPKGIYICLINYKGEIHRLKLTVN